MLIQSSDTWNQNADWRKAVRHRASPCYPLPPDYEELTDVGQSAARVNALCLQETAEDFVYAWTALRSLYLEPLPQNTWYSGDRKTSPPAHYRYIYDCALYPRNVQCFPRGFAKSTLIDEMILLLSLTRPNFKILLLKSMEDFVTETFDRIKRQLEENEMLLEDFGHLRPIRGRGAWSTTRIRLANGVGVVGRSIMSKLPGMRPRYIFTDDAEFDAKMRISPTVLSQQFQDTCKHHIFPMLEEGASITITTTLYSRKLYAYHLATVAPHVDPTVKYFNRVVRAARDGTPGNYRYLWKDKWDDIRLAQLKDEYGPASFAANIMNAPGAEDERLLPLRPKLGYYEIITPANSYEGIKDAMKSPLDSRAVLRTHVRRNGTVEVVDRMFGPAVSGMYRIITADPIRKPSIQSDWAAVIVVGIERNPQFRDVWWILDGRIGRVPDPLFISWVWLLGRRWRAKVVGVEAISSQKKLADSIATEFGQNVEASGLDWTPRVLPVHYQGDFGGRGDNAKPNRISRLEWRFNQDAIKMPEHWNNDPFMTTLHEQIEGFTMDLSLLKNDDAIDALAMVPFAVHGAKKWQKDRSEEEKTADQHVAAGTMRDPKTGISYVQCLDPRRVSAAAISKLTEMNARSRGRAVKPQRPKRSRLSWKGRSL